MKTFYELLEDGTIGMSTPSEKVAKSLGLTLTTDKEIVYGYDGKRYFKGDEPTPPAPTKEEVSETRRQLYTTQVDPITAHINRLKDEEQTDEVIAQIEALKAERAEVVAKIKEENPYPVEEKATDEAENATETA